MMEFPFKDATNTATIVCCHVLDKNKPIMYVSHDEDDGMWQFLSGDKHETHEARIISLKSAFEIDNSVGRLFDMPCGYCAERQSMKDKWIIRKR